MIFISAFYGPAEPLTQGDIVGAICLCVAITFAFMALKISAKD